MHKLLALALMVCPVVAAQIPPPTDLPSHPFFIKKTWFIGGRGDWGYLTMDSKAGQLLIAHGPVVQVVDVESGTLAGQVTGMRNAQAVALDDAGAFGYVSDTQAAEVKVFDRLTFKVVATIPTGPSPRAIVFDPASRLVFAVGADPIPQLPPPNQPRGTRPTPNPRPRSSITVIDTQTNAAIATILLAGKLGFAQSGGSGHIFINIEDRNQIARIDAQTVQSRIQEATPNAGPAGVILDWSDLPRAAPSSGNRVVFVPVPQDCRDLAALAIDTTHGRLFAACGNMKMEVLNAVTGELVTSLPTGPGTDAIGYDSDRALIYSANGGANGSLTIIRQDVTDSYAVVQNLPTRRRARTLAANAATGEVYLVTDILGVKLDQPGNIGALQSAPLNGSFQVVVVGN
jgi:DNA-binding beta-propeller fold protein YncE